MTFSASLLCPLFHKGAIIQLAVRIAVCHDPPLHPHIVHPENVSVPLQVTPAALILFFTAAVVSVTALHAWKRRAVPAARELFWLFIAVVVWSLAGALVSSAPSLELAIFWSKVEYLGSASAAPLTLLFCLAFAHRDEWRTAPHLRAIWILPVLSILLAWTNDWHHLIWTSVSPSPVASSNLYVFQHGPAFWAYIGYSYAYTLAGGILILLELIPSGPLYRQQSTAILFSMIFPWIAGVLYAFNLEPVPGLDITPVAFSLTAVVIAAAMFSTRLLDLIPVAHNLLLQSMQDGVIVLDGRGRVVETNPAMAHLLDHLELPIGGTTEATFGEWPALVTLLAHPSPQHAEIVLPGGSQRYFDVRIVPIRNAQDGDVGQMTVLREITRRKQAELALEAKSREMEQQAITDDLTDLFNRRYINRLLKDEFSRAQRYGLTFSLAMLDIDDFKQINDRHGHQVGDDVLRSVAQVLQSELRANDVPARVGGDEFMVLFPHTSLNGAFQVMERVRASLHQKGIPSEDIRFSCSVGLTSRIPDDTQDTLVERADRLLYDAKGQGRNRVLRSM